MHVNGKEKKGNSGENAGQEKAMKQSEQLDVNQSKDVSD